MAQGADPKELSTHDVLARVRRALEQVKYGKVIITIQGGKPVMVETQKQERIG